MKNFLFVLSCLLVLVLCSCDKKRPTPTPAPTPTPVITPSVTPPPPPLSRQPNKKAFLVGINEYASGSNLHGCVNDVKRVTTQLKTYYGFQDTDIRILLNREATAANILSGLEWLVADTNPLDVRAFWYSGHGAEDVVENFANDPGRINQLICPTNFAWTRDTMIIDKDFVRIFSRIPAGTLFGWGSDSCNSGDLTRKLLPPGQLSKSYPIIPPEVVARVKEAKAKGWTSKAIGSILQVGFISGCQSNQTSADVSDQNGAYGAFTNYFFNTLQDMREQPLTEVGKRVRSDLTRDQFEQRPQVEGLRADRPFLR